MFDFVNKLKVLVYSSFPADVGNSSICFLARKKNASHYGWRDSTDTWSH